jgi:hypothetical protein
MTRSGKGMPIHRTHTWLSAFIYIKSRLGLKETHALKDLPGLGPLLKTRYNKQIDIIMSKNYVASQDGYVVEKQSLGGAPRVLRWKGEQAE